jgi:hypothetical protein
VSDDERLGRLLLIQGESPSQLEDDLMRLDVLVRRIPHTLSANAVYQCGLRDGREAFHKPHDGMREHPRLGFPVWQLYGQRSAVATGINECAAWRLARTLGPPWETMVPTAVMRWLTSEPGLVGGWGPLVRKGNGPSGELTPFQSRDLCDPAAFFDALIGQQDRHLGNQRYEAATGRLTLIDHGFAFPAGRWRLNASAFVQARHRDGHETLSDGEIAMLLSLPDSDAFGELEQILESDQMHALQWRRDEMLKTGRLLEPSSEGLAPLT